MSVIQLEQVKKVFNKGRANEVTAVRDVSFRIGQGETVVLKGPSGSGKTSLLGLIGCMSRPTEGKIIVNGNDAAKLPERFLTEIRRNIFGFIFQHFNLISGITVLENIMLPLYTTGEKLSAIRTTAESVIEKLDLTKRTHFPVQGLSGGEQQRVAISRALVNNPEIILADEPTAHLDTKLSEELIGILHRLNQEGKTIIIATHDPLVYERDFVDRLVEMRDGKVTGIQT
jgi:putative ABC transport system ATP-binding protein